MKLLYFDDFKLGVLKDNAVIDVSSVVREIPNSGPHNLISGLIERFGDYRTRLEEAVKRGAELPSARFASALLCLSRTTSTAWR